MIWNRRALPAAAGLPLPRRELIRVCLAFVFMVLLVAAVSGHLASQALTLQVLREQTRLGRQQAEEIARQVVSVGGQDGVIDYSRVRRNRTELERWIGSRISPHYFIRHVEVRDRFGGRLVFVSGALHWGPAARSVQTPVDLPILGPKDIHVPLGAGSPSVAGEVVLGIAEDALHQELARLDRSLRIKLALAAALVLGLLLLALLYVVRLVHKNRALDQARQSAARASYIGLLASGLAHEIRNPLNAMNMNLQMLEEELHSLPEGQGREHQELLESAKREIERLENLVNNFLTYARPSQPRFESRDLNALVRELRRFLEVDFRAKQVELVEDLEPLLPAVEIDETQIKQALMNLLVNARQVLQAGGRVLVRTRAGSSGDVVLEVVDDGPGIPREARERIFEVFYSSRGGGTGLGLPIAKQIVERHGGRIMLDSEEGRGTTFRIRLPRHQARQPRPPAAAGGVR